MNDAEILHGLKKLDAEILHDLICFKPCRIFASYSCCKKSGELSGKYGRAEFLHPAFSSYAEILHGLKSWMQKFCTTLFSA